MNIDYKGDIVFTGKLILFAFLVIILCEIIHI